MPMPKDIHHVVKFKSLFLQAMWDIPEIVLSTGMGCIGMVMAGVGLRNYYLRDGDNREYKLTYVIMRGDDPRSARLKNPIITAYKT